MHPETLPRLKAPRDDGAVLVHPPLNETGALLAANAERLAAARVDLQGRPLCDLRSLAHREALEAARRYLQDAGEPIPKITGERIIVAGHQPELFHPGVWFKNFALQCLARQHRAVPLNLIVDNDAAKPAVVHVPRDTHLVRVPFDAGLGEVPYEERQVRDEQLFATFAERVEPLVRAWPFRPLLDVFWPATRRRPTPLLGERLAAGRRAMERAWGAAPLEAPLSRICQTEAFAWFAMHVLRELPRFHADYNQAVRRYRQRHDVRSPMHPVPDLSRDGDWLEAPFWAWRAGEQRRQRLWVLARGGVVNLRAGQSAWPSVTGSATAQCAALQKLAADGFKIRTRALTTTLFTRLLLGELFIHGIGGGKYDEVTDELFRDFFQLHPPGYLILTATLLLPLERFPGAEAERLRLRRLSRDLRWNPQRHLEQAGNTAAELAQLKQDLAGRPCATHQQRVERFMQLRQITERLHAFVQIEQDRVHRAAADAERQQLVHAVRLSREISFCLHPEEKLRGLFQQFLPG